MLFLESKDCQEVSEANRNDVFGGSLSAIPVDPAASNRGENPCLLPPNSPDAASGEEVKASAAGGSLCQDGSPLQKGWRLLCTAVLRALLSGWGARFPPALAIPGFLLSNQLCLCDTPELGN